jgi:hypothetical protein
MTEEEWLSCEDPSAMLHWVHATASPHSNQPREPLSDRKLRLFCVSCLTLSDQTMLSTSRYNRFAYGEDGERIANPAETAYQWARRQEDYDPPRTVKAAILRDIVGNPFRLHDRGQPWLGIAALAALSPEIQGIANDVYENRRWDLMPVLADALEDSGCSEQGFLDHLRSPATHYRWCWALDLILGEQ